MKIQEIDEKLVPKLEEYASELGVERIYAGSGIDLLNSENFLYPVYIFHNGLKRKIEFGGNFITSLDDEFDFTLNKIKEMIKKEVQNNLE